MSSSSIRPNQPLIPSPDPEPESRAPDPQVPRLQCPAMHYRYLVALVAALAFGSSSAPMAQQVSVHLNPVIAKLAAGKTVYGLINSGDLSLVNARETARARVDFVYADMEHNPLDFPGLALFLLGLTDKAAIVSKGNLQPNVALFARFPQEAHKSTGLDSQQRDLAVMGVTFTGVDAGKQPVVSRPLKITPMRPMSSDLQ